MRVLVCCVVQAKLLTPLTFTRHCLCPLAAFTSGSVRTFFTMEGGESEFAKFTLPALKVFLKARSYNVSVNKQQLVAHAIGCPKLHFFHKLAIFWSAEKTM